MTTHYSATSSSGLPLRASLLIKMLEKLDSGSMRLNLPNGEEYVFKGKKVGN